MTNVEEAKKIDKAHKIDEISRIEAAKKNAAKEAVKDHFDPSARYIGIGSGTTIVYVVDAIKAKGVTADTKFIPTGYQSRQLVLDAFGPEQLVEIDVIREGRMLDVAFDGADEVDEDLNCIKGGGACLLQEKMVATQARKFICVADHRKYQPRLLTRWPTIPIEIAPVCATRVLGALRALGSPAPFVRHSGAAKAGPVQTDNNNYIIDAPFPPLLISSDIVIDGEHAGMGKSGIWEIGELARRIKLIEGVVGHGIFSGRNGSEVARDGEGFGGEKPVAAYFGMESGEVDVRYAVNAK
ncbi:MAG: ribose-5-phosphate isomerase rki1 [Pycnora praestabilis]|nr:MAG: ribose-5-phosphate isomerase rki1 [Pycnora praestabilis]